MSGSSDDTLLSRCSLATRRRHNQLVPIAQLPDDLLSEIFMYCAHSPFDEAIPVPSQWLGITHVCHYWREIALSNPKLWTTITFSEPLLVYLFYFRSSNLPLALRCDLSYESMTHLQSALQTQIRGRTKYMDIRGSSWLLDELIEAELNVSTLSIMNHTHNDQNEGGFLLSDSPFLAQAHGITSLALKYCAFAWDSPIYSSNLTSLTLSNIDQTHRPAASRFFSILAHMPALENLTLVHVTPSDLRTSRDHILLPKLTSLHLEEPASICTNLLSSMNFPKTARIKICAKKSKVADNGSRLLKAVALRSTKLAIYTEVRLAIEGNEPVLQVQLSSSAGPLLMIDFEDPPDVDTTALAIFQQFPLSNITLLDLHGTKNTQISQCRTEWEEMLRPLDHLRVLQLSGCRPVLILETLFEYAMRCIGVSMTPSTRHIGPDGISRQLIKNLSLIRLVDLNLDSSVSSVTNKIDLLDLLTAFIWALSHRRSQVPVVHIERCKTVCPRRLNRLRQFTEVVYDGDPDHIQGSNEGNYFDSSMDVFVQLALWYQEHPDEEDEGLDEEDEGLDEEDERLDEEDEGLDEEDERLDEEDEGLFHATHSPSTKRSFTFSPFLLLLTVTTIFYPIYWIAGTNLNSPVRP